MKEKEENSLFREFLSGILLALAIAFIIITFWSGWNMFAEQGAKRQAFSDCVVNHSPEECTIWVESLFSDE